MQTDPTARHSPIGSFQRKCYLAHAQHSRANLGKLVGLHGHHSGHGGVDPPPAMTVFLGERLTAEASEIAGKHSGVGCRSQTLSSLTLLTPGCRGRPSEGWGG
jgi:hypothetical protein